MRPPIDGLTGSDPSSLDGVYLLHSMGDSFAICGALEERSPASALIVGAGYIGLEMAEALPARGLSVTVVEQLPEVLPTVDPELGALVHAELERHGVEVLTGTTVNAIRDADRRAGRLTVDGSQRRARRSRDRSTSFSSSSACGRTPSSPPRPAADTRRARARSQVDRQMETNLPDVFAAGDCVVTYHRLLDDDTTSRSARPRTSKDGSRARTPSAAAASSRAASAPRSSRSSTWPPPAPASATTKRPPPGSIRSPSSPTPTTTRSTTPEATASESASQATARPAGSSASSSFGHRHAEIAKRIDTAATAIYHGMTVDALNDLDLSYTPPFGSPWDALQAAAQQWASTRTISAELAL